MEKQIKVLIVDDSRIYRGFIEKALSSEPDIEIIGTALNGRKAIEFIENAQPDIITLDIEMPEMDGIETLKELRKFNDSHPELKDIGAVIVSSLSKSGADITIKCLDLGAFDFIWKPSFNNVEENIKSLNYQLVSKMRIYALRKDRTISSQPLAATAPQISKASVISTTTGHTKKTEAILIGCSTGGPKALADFLPMLSEVTELPFVIVQHMPPIYTLSLAENLDKRCKHTVVEASNNKLIEPKFAYIAPGGKHLVLKKAAGTGVITGIADTPPENNCKPSVDVMFRSAIPVYEGNVIAIILTGMGNDGTEGCRSLKRKGALIIAQDETTSVVWGMPGSIVSAGLADKVLPLDKIAENISSMLSFNKLLS